MPKAQDQRIRRGHRVQPREQGRTLRDGRASGLNEQLNRQRGLRANDDGDARKSRCPHQGIMDSLRVMGVVLDQGHRYACPGQGHGEPQGLRAAASNGGGFRGIDRAGYQGAACPQQILCRRLKGSCGWPQSRNPRSLISDTRSPTDCGTLRPDVSSLARA
jgi:hypothetical protein